MTLDCIVTEEEMNTIFVGLRETVVDLKNVEEFGTKFISPMQGKTHTEETKRLMSMKARQRKPISEETRALISKASSSRTNESKKKISETLKQKQLNNKLLTCPHCNKTGNYFGMIRWHFDKCKLIT